MARVRSVRTALLRLFESSSAPIYVLDEQRRVIYCNSAFAVWMGSTPEQIVGLRCSYQSSPQVAEGGAAGSLCPPPEVFRGQRGHSIVTAGCIPNSLKQRRAEFLPLGGERMPPAGVIAILDESDISSATADLETAFSEPAALHARVAAFHQQAGQRYVPERLVGDSLAMKQVREQFLLAAGSRSRVLIVGPKGSGREYLARTIHYSQQQTATASLVPLACSLLDSDLLQSTVSAFVRRWIELEPDQPSALLLLDVDQLPAEAQRDLAGFLDIGELDLRTLATARQPLVPLAEQGLYREDLAMALSTLVIQLPGLSQRREDIPLLAQVFVEEINAAGQRQLGGFTPEAMDLLVAYGWPGNLDELMSTVRDAHQRAEGTLIEPSELSPHFAQAMDAMTHPPRQEETIELDAFLRQIETELIVRALRRSKGNKARAARLLGLSRARLLRRIAQLQLDQ